MIFGNIKDAKRYYSVHPRFKEAFEFLAELSADNLKDGIAEEGFKIITPVSFATCTDTDDKGAPRKFEAHRDYLDIHYCIAGSEAIGYNDISRLTPVTEYNAEGDYQLLEGESYRLILYPGDFCIVFPEDAHIPMLCGEGKEVMKAIVKAKV